jgi:tight adherence protein C
MSPLVLLAAFFVTVMGVITIAGYFVLSRKTAAVPWHSAPKGPAPPPLPSALDSQSMLESTLLRVGAVMPSRQAHAQQYRKKLMLAGYRQTNAPELYIGIKFALVVVLAVLFGAVRLFWGGDVIFAVVAMCAGAGLGWMIPDRFLEHAIRKRSQKLLYGVPAAIDLMVLSLEAGQSLDAALAEAARELQDGYPELSRELHQVQIEMPASRSRAEVFRSLAERNAEPELKRLAQVFLDSDRFGTGLAPALRNHVKFLRVRLRQQAYEQARKVSVKLVFPVFFLIFPAVILVTLGPALIQVFSQLNVLLK